MFGVAVIAAVATPVSFSMADDLFRLQAEFLTEVRTVFCRQAKCFPIVSFVGKAVLADLKLDVGWIVVVASPVFREALILAINTRFCPALFKLKYLF